MSYGGNKGHENMLEQETLRPVDWAHRTLPSRSEIYEHRAVRRLLERPDREIPRGRPISEYTDWGFRAGDLVGFSGANLASDFINLVTYGVPRRSLSHVGVLAEYEGELLLWESTLDGDLPCVLRCRLVRGVQAHRIWPRISEYRGKVWHYPLTRHLYAHEDRRLTRYCLASIGKGYDEIGAFRAGGFGFSIVESALHEPAKNAVFCSEFCAGAHNDIGIFPTAHVNRWNPNLLVRCERVKGLVGRPRVVRL